MRRGRPKPPFSYGMVKPVFAVNEKVWSKYHSRVVKIRRIVWDDDHLMYGYYFHEVPLYWLENGLRRQRCTE